MLVPHGKPYAGKLHVRFDEGAGAPDEGRSALLYCERIYEAVGLVGLGFMRIVEGQ